MYNSTTTTVDSLDTISINIEGNPIKPTKIRNFIPAIKNQVTAIAYDNGQYNDMHSQTWRAQILYLTSLYLAKVLVRKTCTMKSGLLGFDHLQVNGVHVVSKTNQAVHKFSRRLQR